MPVIRQLFFDCDNTLVLSEYLAFESCAGLVNQILAEQHIEERYGDEQLIVEFIGLSFRGMLSALQKKYGFQMSSEDTAYYIKQEENMVIDKLNGNAIPCDGSMEVLETLTKNEQYGLAIVSSSAIKRIHASIKATGQDKFFPTDHVFSAVSSLDKAAPKPSPAVYLHAMRKLGVKPEQCVAVEDSKSGALAAVKANITCIAYVGAYPTKAKQNEVAKTLIASGCKTVMYDWNQYFDCLRQIENI